MPLMIRLLKPAREWAMMRGQLLQHPEATRKAPIQEDRQKAVATQRCRSRKAAHRRLSVCSTTVSEGVSHTLSLGFALALSPSLPQILFPFLARMFTR